MRSLFLLPILALFLASCGGDTASTTAADEAAEKAADEAAMETPADPATSGKITIEPMSESPDFPGAAITSMSYENGKFSFGIDGGADGYTLGGQTPDAEQKMCANSAKGQHIHLIVDDKPYAAKYEADFEHEVEDGKHYLLAFLSRSYHESIKHEGAETVKLVTMANQTATDQSDVPGEMLFYSRPKGTYTGKDTENIMLDFYLHNVTLGADRKVKVETGGQSFTVEQWQPYILKGLPMGENTVTLTLVDGEGNAVNAPLNPVSRTFTLAADKTES
ncbi:MAG: hypothetical protein AAGJ82_00180 [Bacteroidota bacterium]